MSTRKKAFFVCLAAFVVLILMSCIFLLGMRFSSPGTDYWAYALDNIICIGDSLTDGTYMAGDLAWKNIEENYPFYLSRMLGTPVENAGVGGYSASDWFINCSDNYDYGRYNAAIIWLGTNNGYTDTLDTDVEPYSDYNSYAETETGYYCRIIEKIQQANPNCRIYLMTVFASKDDVKISNRVIKKIAARYDLQIIDASPLGMEHRELHAGLENPHFGKAGNIAVARHIVTELGKYYSDNPLRCEFGIHLK